MTLSTRPGDSKHHPRSVLHTRRVLRFNRLVLVVVAAVFAGCGGAKTDDGPSGQASPSAGSGAETAVNPSGSEMALPSSSGPGDPSGAGESQATGPAKESGIQLPEAALPSDDSTGSKSSPTDSRGPAKPGDGGIEMPDLEPPSTPDGSTSQASPDGKAVQLQYASWPEIETRAKSTGKITVVDLWSTVCEPCVKEFPGLVRLSQSMASEVTCIGVSVDYDGRKSRPPEFYSERVGGFLSAVGADFDNYLCNTPSDDVFATVGLPSIPAVLIYDADGKLVKQFVDSGDTLGFSYDKDIIPFVENLAG